MFESFDNLAGCLKRLTVNAHFSKIAKLTNCNYKINLNKYTKHQQNCLYVSDFVCIIINDNCNVEVSDIYSKIKS